MARLTVVDIAVAAGMEQALVADSISFEQLVAAHEGRVRRLAHRLLGWRDGSSDMDDVVQDVFLAAMKNLPRFRGEASIGTWLTRMTINRCRTHRRKQFLKLRWLGKQSVSDETPPTSYLAADETSAKVRAAVQQLSPSYREVIVLLYLEELSVSEIAMLLGISRAAVDVRVHRARVRLKEKLTGLMDE